MALMWPRTLPPDVTGNTLRSTECEVFRRLEVVLDDSFVVFYSRPWLGLKPDGEEIDGECDFIVAHAELGMLTLEVKGGAVAYDPRTDRWTSRDQWMGHTQHQKPGAPSQKCEIRASEEAEDISALEGPGASGRGTESYFRIPQPRTAILARICRSAFFASRRRSKTDSGTGF